MTVLGSLASFAHRRIAPLLTPYHHRRHQHTLKRGRVRRADLERAAASWWGGDPRWFPGSTPPRRHNRVTPLVDGECFLGDLHAALARAEHYVYIAGWCLTPDLPLRRTRRQDLVDTRLVELLRDTANRVPVRILLWGGPVAVSHPTRGAMLGVVVANSLLLLFVFWELVGLASYLLIGFWIERPSAGRSAAASRIASARRRRTDAAATTP